MSSRRGELRALVRDILLAADTLAGDSVFLPRDWPTHSGIMPAIAIATPREQKQNVTGRNGPPHFNTLTWLQLRCQVSGVDQGEADDTLETLVNQAELAVMGLLIGPPQRFQQIVQVEYEAEPSATGDTHIAAASLMFGFEYRERFDIVLTDPLEGLDVTVSGGPAIRIPVSQASLSGNAVLQFASALDGVTPGMLVTNATTNGTLPAGTLVAAVDSFLLRVTMSASAIGPGIGLGDTIEFTGPVLATASFDIPS